MSLALPKSSLARTLLAGLLILTASLAAYAPALNGKFLWDDLYLVGSNPFFKSPRFVLEVFRHWLFLDSFSRYYRPVQNLSYLLDYAIWNRTEYGYHLSNILLHAAGACLLMLVTRRCLRAVAADALSGTSMECVSFLVALAWAVHPIHNAAVAYVAGRADSIAMMAALAGWLLLTAEWTGWRRGVGLALGPLCFLLALCAKEIAFIWIALFAFYLFFFDRRLTARAKASGVGLLLAVFAVYIWLRHLPGPRAPQEGMAYPEMPERVMLMLRALGDYTSLIFWPGNLHMERTVYSPQAYRSLAAWQQDLRGEYLSLLGLATIGLFIFACRSARPGRRLRVLGVSWFVLGFLPISNLFPLAAQVAEHWIYMASAGYLLMLAGFALALPSRWRRAVAMAAPVAIVALAARTAIRADDWADPETFFIRTIAAGGFPERVSVDLAELYISRGRQAEAEAVLRKTVAESPDYPGARIRLGMLLNQQGRKAEAEKFLKIPDRTAEMLAKTTPQSWHAALDVASGQYGAHQPEVALATLETAMKRYPGIWELEQYRAQVIEAIRGPSAALPEVRDFVASHWWHMDARLLLAHLQAASRDYPASAATCRDAATLDIHSAAPYEAEAKTWLMAGDYPSALRAQSDAIGRAGGSEPRQYLVLAAILDELKRPAEARAAAEVARALETRPPRM